MSDANKSGLPIAAREYVRAAQNGGVLMMDQDLLELLRAKVGGDYILATLYQTRMRELSSGLPPLVKTSSPDPWEIIAEEILQDKLSLAMGAEAERIRADLPEETAAK